MKRMTLIVFLIVSGKCFNKDSHPRFIVAGFCLEMGHNFLYSVFGGSLKCRFVNETASYKLLRNCRRTVI